MPTDTPTTARAPGVTDAEIINTIEECRFKAPFAANILRAWLKERDVLAHPPAAEREAPSEDADDETCTDCWGTGYNDRMEQRCDCQGPAAPSDAIALEIWTDFLDANPSGVTSPAEYPDHALITADELADLMRDYAERTAAEREAPSYDYAQIPEDEEDRNRLLEAVVYAENGPHTLAHVAAKLNWPLIATAEAVGKHYWMMLTGDLTNPETTKVEGDGE